jgi:glycosyltransferase involved in cell wall biosynthesis
MPAEGTLRIAQIAPLWAKIPPDTYGGIELAVNLLVEELVARGHDVTLFASADCVTSAKLRPVIEENLLAMMTDGRAYAGEYYINAAVAMALREQHDFDVLHFHTGAQWVPFGDIAQVPSAFTLHTALTPDDHWVLKSYPKVKAVGISQYQVHGVEPQPEIIYNGCDFEQLDPSYEPGSYLAFLGRMSEYKNPLGAIQVAKQLGMRLIMAGMPQNSGERAYFEQKVLPLVDGDQIRHIGAVNQQQKNALLRGAAALVFPIQWAEPFGIVMIEAMGCGTPVAAVRLGSVPEVVDDGITGFIVDTVDELAAKLPEVIALDRRRVREHARQRFNFRKMVEDYETLYRRLVGRFQSAI